MARYMLTYRRNWSINKFSQSAVDQNKMNNAFMLHKKCCKCWFVFAWMTVRRISHTTLTYILTYAHMYIKKGSVCQEQVGGRKCTGAIKVGKV